MLPPPAITKTKLRNKQRKDKKNKLKQLDEAAKVIVKSLPGHRCV